MNALSKLIKKKSGQNVADFIDGNLHYSYFSFIAAVTTGTLKMRDVKTIIGKTDISIEEFYNAWEKSYSVPPRKQLSNSSVSQQPKFTKTPKTVENPFK